MKFIPVLLMLLWQLPVQTFACSAFFYNGEKKLYGKNFDWSTGDGYIIKNNRGQQKFAYGIRGNNQAQWIAKYGSVTFNQVGKENPYGGINEKGLVVEQLWLTTSYYQDNHNATVSELEWVQYQLDNYSTVAEVIAHINGLTIQPTKATVHYFIADEEGHSAVIDFTEGKTIVSQKDNHFQVITNSTYSNSLNYWSKAGKNIDSNSRTSEDRFCQITHKLAENPLTVIDQAFAVLHASSENRAGYKTFWTIVYDVAAKEIHYKSFTNNTVKVIRLNDYSFDKESGVLASAVNTDFFRLETYTSVMNQALLNTALLMMRLKMDTALANEHQMRPDKKRMDTIYRNNYIDVKLTFTIKKKKGLLFYTFIQGEESFKRRKGVYAAMWPVKSAVHRSIVYTLPKGEYAIAAFHDLNNDYLLDRGMFGIPKAFAFSNNARGLLGLPPRYKKAKMNLLQDVNLHIHIK